MIAFLGLPAVYLLALATGVRLERRLTLNSLLLRVLVVITLGAAQLLVILQGLSLVQWLTGEGLLITSMMVSALLHGLLRNRPLAVGRVGWKALAVEAWRALARPLQDRVVLLLLLLALGAMVLACAMGGLMIPLADIYHFEMPLYWKQNQSIGPFPINNPRIVSLSFLAEALALPGYLYTNSGVMFVFLTLGGAGLSLAVVFALARRMGCSAGAAAGAAALMMGFSVFSGSLLSLRACNYLAGLWTGASLLFLLDARPTQGLTRANLSLVGFSVVCFFMACGSKNSTTLLAPVYGLCLILTLGRRVFHRPVWLVIAGCGLIGLACSGVGWNYLQNIRWFGDPRGPRFLQETGSREFAPRAVWTRLVRGAVLVGVDTVYLPKSVQPVCAKVASNAVRLLGGQAQLDEDSGFYAVDDRTFQPGKGLGLVGLIFFVPGFLIALARFGGRRGRPPVSADERFATGALLLLTIGAFVMCHLVMRWQSIGLIRLMPAFSLLAAPFCAFTLSHRWCRAGALLVLLFSSLIFLAADGMMVARRVALPPDMPVYKWIARRVTAHGMEVQYNGRDQVLHTLLVREEYTQREILQKCLETLPQPCRIGFVGGENFESYYLFGSQFQNRVVSLSDARLPRPVAELSDKPAFLVIESCDAPSRQWAQEQNYQLIFEASHKDNCLVACFELKGGPAVAR